MPLIKMIVEESPENIMDMFHYYEVSSESEAYESVDGFDFFF